jgi:hypothetical protein
MANANNAQEETKQSSTVMFKVAKTDYWERKQTIHFTALIV